MNVIIVDESIKKSKQSARRIVSDYLQNVGRNVWIGSITESGLENLRLRLQQSASKNMSVACFKITTRKEHKLEWIVGSNINFDEDGNFAFRYKQKDDFYELMLNSYSRELRNVLVKISHIASIFHDIGKNFVCFQYKLLNAKDGDNKYISDPIRHEKLSYDVFCCLIEEIYKKEKVKEVSSENNENDLLTVIERLEKGFEELKKDKAIKEDAIEFEFWDHKIYKTKKYPVFISMIAHLILTHHKLPDNFGDIRDEPFKGNGFKTYENEKAFQTFKDSKEIQIQDEQSFFHLYEQQPFLLKESIDKCIEVLRDLNNRLTDHNDYQELNDFFKNENQCYFITHYILRTSLILGDQYFSSLVLNEDGSNDENIAYANIKNEKYDQTLKSHLDGVSKYTKEASRFHLNCVIGKKQLNTCDAPKMLRKKIPLKFKNNFGWQDEVVKSVERSQIDYESNFGFFGVVMGKTGSGKTIANAKLMSALSNYKDLRFNVALGLKTLTLQTYDEYKQEVGFESIVGVIGSNEDRELHEINKENEYNKNNKDGFTQTQNKSDKDNLGQAKDEESEFDLVGGNNIMKQPTPNVFDFSKKDSKLKKIIDTPIVVSTIDYFINAIDAKKSSKTRYLSRLMTSDLVIDEIDSFSNEQSINIAKLIFLMGVYGRKVIISSATTPSYLIKFYQNAYEKGYNIHCAMSGRNNEEIYYGIYTHCPELNITEKRKIDVDDFVATFKKYIEQEKPKRKISQINIGDEVQSGVNDVYNKIIDASFFYHKNNSFNKKKVNISVGLIEFANTKHTFDFTKHLCSKYDFFIENDTLIKIECYHAKNFNLRKSYVEKELSNILNRKNDSKNEEIVSNERVKGAIDLAHENNVSNVMILVISSPIIETGRDFDFDWAICEPRSHHGIIQIAGRVLRHRDIYNRLNFGVLSHSLRLLENNSLPPYSLPGAENHYSGKNFEEYLKLINDDKSKSFYELFEYNEDGDVIDSSISLISFENPKPIKKIEDNYRYYIENKEHNFNDFLDNKEEFLTCKNSLNNIFRKKWQEEETVFYNIDMDRFSTEQNPNIVNYKNEDLSCVREEIFLINESLEIIKDVYQKEELKIDLNIQKNFVFNEYLGFKYI